MSRLPFADMLPIFLSMAHQLPRTETVKVLRERRERLATELASLEPVSPAEGGLTARELAIWRQRLAELDGRIARHDASAE